MNEMSGLLQKALERQQDQLNSAVNTVSVCMCMCVCACVCVYICRNVWVVYVVFW